MRPQYENPYWDAIVGDNWPGIEEGAWRTLESAARAGAAEMDVTAFEQARRAFDEHIRISAALQPAQDALRVEQGRLWALTDVLNLAADLFGEMAQLVRRTCARILDILDSAVAGINGLRAQQDETQDERDDRLARIDRIVRNARDEVAAVMARATQQAGPQGFPELSAIADLLGIPGMDEAGNGWQPHWGPGGPGRPAGPARPGPRHPRGPDHGRPGSTVPQPHPNQNPVPSMDPTGDGSLPGAKPGGPPDADADTDADRPSTVPPGTAVVPDPNRNERPPAPVDHGGGGGGANWGDAPGYRPPTPQPGMPGANPGFLGGIPNVTAPPHYSSNDAVADSGGDTHTPGAAADSVGGSARSDRTGTEDSASNSSDSAKSTGGSADSRTDSNSGTTGHDLSDASPVSAGDPALGGPAGAGGPIPFLPFGPAPAGASASPQGAGAQPISAQTGTGAGNSASPGTGAGPAAGGAANNAPRPGQVAGPGGVTSSSPSSPPGSGTVSAPAGDHASRNRTGRPEQRETTEHAAPEHDSSAFQAAVGAAMAAAAAPSFVLGDRVDGDSALARTLLRSILAVVDCSPIAPAWAVAVTRHASGVSAFVTSNEGRGWLPAGLYLPRTVSTPWVWQAARDAAWEGVADPARVLVEFGRAWGRTSGAEVSAVASSLVIDPILRAALPSVRFEGGVGPSPELNLGVPAPDRRDRLEVTASSRLLDRVMAVQEPTIGLRCTELARDAHARVARAIPDPLHAMGTPALRQRILAALRNRAPVPDEWFEELRDADDLLAASTVSKRLDVSRIPLGELRFEQSGEPAVLRAIQLQRRCDELVLLLAQTPDRQCLRDAVYLHAHLAEHPAIAAAGESRVPPRVSN
ncbi:hypothetical protein AB0L82_40985 [Nocardia sp. NPDC052001]|uniref:hypothetical protein n=1 Tax=Nocardia sp. NPDC052001 TaxID=3154853 RepID=UPI003433B76A